MFRDTKSLAQSHPLLKTWLEPKARWLNLCLAGISQDIDCDHEVSKSFYFILIENHSFFSHHDDQKFLIQLERKIQQYLLCEGYLFVPTFSYWGIAGAQFTVTQSAFKMPL
jgi:hypothetical protein